MVGEETVSSVYHACIWNPSAPAVLTDLNTLYSHALSAWSTANGNQTIVLNDALAINDFGTIAGTATINGTASQVCLDRARARAFDVPLGGDGPGRIIGLRLEASALGAAGKNLNEEFRRRDREPVAPADAHGKLNEGRVCPLLHDPAKRLYFHKQRRLENVVSLTSCSNCAWFGPSWPQESPRPMALST